MSIDFTSIEEELIFDGLDFLAIHCRDIMRRLEEVGALRDTTRYVADSRDVDDYEKAKFKVLEISTLYDKIKNRNNTMNKFIQLTNYNKATAAIPELYIRKSEVKALRPFVGHTEVVTASDLVFSVTEAVKDILQELEKNDPT